MVTGSVGPSLGEGVGVALGEDRGGPGFASGGELSLEQATERRDEDAAAGRPSYRSPWTHTVTVRAGQLRPTTQLAAVAVAGSPKAGAVGWRQTAGDAGPHTPSRRPSRGADATASLQDIRKVRVTDGAAV